MPVQKTGSILHEFFNFTLYATTLQQLKNIAYIDRTVIVNKDFFMLFNYFI